MNGYVDEQLRALLPIQVGAPQHGETNELLAWIDTAFNGSLVIPKSMVEWLKLTPESTAEAILADGHTVELETYGCRIEWFDAVYQTQAVTNDGEYSLLGTMLLANRQLEIDYSKRIVSLS